MHLYPSIYIHSSVLWKKICRRMLNPTPLLRTESDLHKLMLENFSQLPVSRLIESHATNSCHHFLLLGLSILTTKAASIKPLLQIKLALPRQLFRSWIDSECIFRYNIRLNTCNLDNLYFW